MGQGPLCEPPDAASAISTTCAQWPRSIQRKGAQRQGTFTGSTAGAWTGFSTEVSMVQRSKTLKHWWKRFRTRPAARRAMRGRIALGSWPEEAAAYARLRAAGLTDRQAITRMLVVHDRAWDRAIDDWIPFDRDAYAGSAAYAESGRESGRFRASRNARFPRSGSCLSSAGARGFPPTDGPISRALVAGPVEKSSRRRSRTGVAFDTASAIRSIPEHAIRVGEAMPTSELRRAAC